MAREGRICVIGLRGMNAPAVGRVGRRAGTTENAATSNATRAHRNGSTVVVARTSQTLVAWRQQFKKQRQLYQRKFVSFWLTTIDTRRNPRELRHAVNNMLQPPKEQPTFKLGLTSSNFANFFRNKVDNIRESTAASPPLVIVNRQAPI